MLAQGGGPVSPLGGITAGCLQFPLPFKGNDNAKNTRKRRLPGVIFYFRSA